MQVNLTTKNLTKAAPGSEVVAGSYASASATPSICGPVAAVQTACVSALSTGQRSVSASASPSIVLRPVVS